VSYKYSKLLCCQKTQFGVLGVKQVNNIQDTQPQQINISWGFTRATLGPNSILTISPPNATSSSIGDQGYIRRIRVLKVQKGRNHEPPLMYFGIIGSLQERPVLFPITEGVCSGVFLYNFWIRSTTRLKFLSEMSNSFEIRSLIFQKLK